MYRLLTVLFVFSSFTAQSQFLGLIVNEFSQGNTGSREYIEVLVLGKRTCTDTTADLRGWMFDDQNGWYGNGSLTQGHYRFKNVQAWSAVPIGSIILFYNAAANSKNTSITIADDPYDFNKDLVYVVPINTISLIEEHDTEPATGAGIGYVYPSPGSTAGYTNASNTWPFHIGLNNDSDVISMISPFLLIHPFFSIAYAYRTVPPQHIPTVTVPGVGSGHNCYLADSLYHAAASWHVAPVPAQETPGYANTAINADWIENMRKTPKPTTNYRVSCNTVPVEFSSAGVTATGLYSITSQNSNGCVDTSRAYIILTDSTVTDSAGCNSVLFEDSLYTSNTTITKSIKSRVDSGCDSLVRRVNITILPKSASFITSCIKQGETYIFNNRPLTSGGWYTDTLQSISGCDSIVQLYLVVSEIKVWDTASCGPIQFNAVSFSADTILRDTVRSRVTNCDSIIHVFNIDILDRPTLLMPNDTTICIGDSIMLKVSSPDGVAQWQLSGNTQLLAKPNTDTRYTAYAIHVSGCVDSAFLNIAVDNLNLSISASQNSIYAGEALSLTTYSNQSYNVLTWRPVPLFPNQTSKQQLIFPDSSVYVTAFAKSNYCTDSAGVFVVVKPLDDIYIPTAFTPNGDGLNDVWRIRGPQLKELKLQVFNRWGQVVFQTTEAGKGWDGSFQGKPQQTGSYIYLLTGKTKAGQPIFRKGNFNLIK